MTRSTRLSEDLEARTKEAMKARDEVAKTIYRVVLGELQTAEARSGGELDEAAGHKIVKKLIASNEATLEKTEDAEARARLERENALLLELVPRSLSVEAIVEALAPVTEAIRSAKGDGPAMGIAMKQLKSAGAPVESPDVKAAVAKIREG